VAAVVVIGAGLATLVATAGVRPSARQEVGGIGLAVLMTGLMVLVLANYLRHAARRRGAGSVTRPAQPSSVPTTETNDTISPG
jgi:hypothetical protein